ncbi:periplasmic heavy metal sensor [Thalassococcus sp. S3]|uniref:periplasmic heavy metal sensor n=1 Tax=Thalassococcus sp. S3 TaxID=2017482 RepID=UPI0010241129|nr:periplasmic heavy metal sensor [Thalassococcus sp. S3]QBF31166.1 hypothetical protein CFI11_08025 [Thalassococcus sp. S3]
MSATKRPGRWLRVLLIVSLGANLLFMGAIAGAWARFGGPPEMTPGPPHSGVVFYRELPPETRREMRQSLKRVFAAIRGAGIAEAEEIGAAIRSEPFDAERLGAILDEQAHQIFDAQFDIKDVWLEKVREMSTAERAAYADRVETALKERGKRPPKPPRGD